MDQSRVQAMLRAFYADLFLQSGEGAESSGELVQNKKADNEKTRNKTR